MKVLALLLALASVTMALDHWTIIYEVSDALYGGQEVNEDLKPILVDILDHLMMISFSAPETENAYLDVYPTLESFPENFVPTLNAALEDRHTSPIMIQVFTEMLDRFMTMIFMSVEQPAVEPVQPIITPIMPIPAPIEIPVHPVAPVSPIVEPIVEQPIASQSPLVQLILNIRQN